MSARDELIKTVSKANSEELSIITAMIKCTVEYGDSFLTAMQPAHDNHDRQAMIDIIKEWTAKTKVN